MVKAQFKIQQTAFMILAVFIFFLMVALFWFSLQSKSLKQTAVDLNENQASMLTEFISSSTEFSCNSEYSYCIDTDKIMFLKNNSLYSSLFPVAYIKIVKVFPKQTQEIKCSSSNYPECNLFEIFSNPNILSTSSPKGNFVALCRYDMQSSTPKKICSLGKIIVGYRA